MSVSAELRALLISEIAGPPYAGKGAYAELERRSQDLRRARVSDAIDRALAKLPQTELPDAAHEALAGEWTDDRIREAFIDDGGQAEYYDPINGAREQRRVAGAIFDAWLAARDARISAVRALGEKWMSQHGQTWNALQGRELLRVLDGTAS